MNTAETLGATKMSKAFVLGKWFPAVVSLISCQEGGVCQMGILVLTSGRQSQGNIKH